MTFRAITVRTDSQPDGDGYNWPERTMAITSDGRMVHLGWFNDAGASAGTGRLMLYMSADNGVTWTNMANYDCGIVDARYSFVLDSSNNIHLGYTSRDASEVYYVKATYNAGAHTWAWGAPEISTVARNAAGDYRSKLDITLLDDDKVLIATLQIRAAGAAYLRYAIRDAGGTWRPVNEHLIPGFKSSGGGLLLSDYHLGRLSIAQDLTPTAANLKRWAFMVNGGQDGFWYIYAVENNVTTGAETNYKLVDGPAFGSSNSNFQRCLITASAPNEWTVGAIIGSGSGTTKCWASRFSWTGYIYSPSSITTNSSVNAYYVENQKAISYINGKLCFYMYEKYSTLNMLREHIARFDSGGIVFSPYFWPLAYLSNRIRNMYQGNSRNFTQAASIVHTIGFDLYDEDAGAAVPNFTRQIFETQFGAIPNSGIEVPADGSTVNTDQPQLRKTINSNNLQPRLKLGVQVATNNTFTTNLRTIINPDSTYAENGVQAVISIPVVSELFQGTWYARPFYVDEHNVQGGYGATTSFIVSHPPTTFNWNPTNDTIVIYGGLGNDFSWDFQDTSPTDYQTAYQIIIESNTTGAAVADTGKVVSGATAVSVVIPGTSVGDQLRWKVRVWDSDDVAGPYSAYQIFRAYDAPVVATTMAGNYPSPEPTVTWTYTPGTGGAQVEFRIVVLDHDTQETAYDSGPIAGAGTSFTLPTPALSRNGTYDTYVYATDASGLTGTGIDTGRLATWVAPAQPNFGLDGSLYDTDGFVRVSWSTAALDPNFHSWRVYRRDTEHPDWVLLKETDGLDATEDILDFTAPANMLVTYAVLQVKTFDDALVESDIVYMDSLYPSGTKYWFIEQEYQGQSSDVLTNPGDLLKVAVEHVTADSFSEKYESTIHNVPNRGNKRDVGQRWGYDGSLSGQLRGLGDLTPRQERLALEALRANRRVLIMRTPFGDVVNVTLGEIGESRIAGVGTLELIDVTIPYTELG